MFMAALAQNAAFSATVSAAQHNRFQNIGRNDTPHVFCKRSAPMLEPLLEFRAAIDCKTLRHFKFGQISTVSFKYASI
jgi:hypothetical protein